MGQFCCVCFKDQTSKPVMVDRMMGNVYCQDHSYIMESMQRGLNTERCPSCNFKFYESYGSYVEGYREGNEIKCPNCGKCLREKVTD